VRRAGCQKDDARRSGGRLPYMRCRFCRSNCQRTSTWRASVLLQGGLLCARGAACSAACADVERAGACSRMRSLERRPMYRGFRGGEREATAACHAPLRDALLASSSPSFNAAFRAQARPMPCRAVPCQRAACDGSMADLSAGSCRCCFAAQGGACLDDDAVMPQAWPAAQQPATPPPAQRWHWWRSSTDDSGTAVEGYNDAGAGACASPHHQPGARVAAVLAARAPCAVASRSLPQGGCLRTQSLPAASAPLLATAAAALTAAVAAASRRRLLRSDGSWHGFVASAELVGACCKPPGEGSSQPPPLCCACASAAACRAASRSRAWLLTCVTLLLGAAEWALSCAGAAARSAHDDSQPDALAAALLLMGSMWFLLATWRDARAAALPARGAQCGDDEDDGQSALVTRCTPRAQLAQLCWLPRHGRRL
jgi:hypothetical protein